MQPKKTLLALLMAGVALTSSAGCGGSEGGQTDLAELQPPPQVSAGGKSAARRLPPRPKFGSPPRSKTAQP